MSWWIWVIVAVVVAAVLVAIVIGGTKQKRQRNRHTAAEIREEAAERAPELERHEAHARQTEAAAAAAQAEAARKQAEAERLSAEAQTRQQTADRHRRDQAETLQRADEIDPDVDHKRGDRDQSPDQPESTSLAQGHPPTQSAGSTASAGSAEKPVTHPDGSTEPVRERPEDGYR